MNKYKQVLMSNQLAINGLLDDIRSGKFNPTYGVPFATKMYTNMLSAKDLTMCANRYKWELPIDLTSQQLESMLYTWGSLCMFEDENGILTFARYVANGGLNKYGQLTQIKPIDFAGHTYNEVYNVLNEKTTPILGQKYAVILQDYTTVMPMQEELSRAALNGATTIHDQVEVYRQMYNNIVLSIKKALALCETEEQKRVVEQEISELFFNDKPVQAVTVGDRKGKADLGVEMFNFANSFDTQNYCQTIEFYDKTRRSFNGIPAPDGFEKKERKITAEAEDTTTHTQLILQDGLACRKNAIKLFQKYCTNAANKSISVELNEALEEKQEGEYVNGESVRGNVSVQGLNTRL